MGHVEDLHPCIRAPETLLLEALDVLRCTRFKIGGRRALLD